MVDESGGGGGVEEDECMYEGWRRRTRMEVEVEAITVEKEGGG